MKKLLARQLKPLLLCYALGCEPVQGRTKMQKLIFLMQQKLESQSNMYLYQAKDYGPFSWQLASDIDYLRANGYITEKKRIRSDGGERYILKITEKGQEFVARILKDSRWGPQFRNQLDLLERLKNENNSKNLNQLLREVYSKYPKYAVHSKAQLY